MSDTHKLGHLRDLTERIYAALAGRHQEGRRSQGLWHPAA
jgi:hypothetical protein